MMKPISTRTHARLDYITAGVLFLLPRLLGWSASATRLLTGAALGTLIYSMLTRYELGVAKIIPMKTHLAIDKVNGAMFLAAPLLMRDEDTAVLATFAGIGAYELAASMMTRPEPEPKLRRTVRKWLQEKSLAGVGKVLEKIV